MSDEAWARAVDAIMLAVWLSPLPPDTHYGWAALILYGWMESEHGYSAPSVQCAGADVSNWREEARAHGIDLSGLDAAVAGGLDS